MALFEPGKEKCGRKTVTTAGTRERLFAADTVGEWVIVTAETDNTGIIVIGDDAVVAALATRKGIPLLAGDSITLPMANIQLDTTVNGDGVTYLYN